MKFTSLLSAVAVICSCVGCVNASSSSLEIGFSTDCNKKVNCSVSYCEGMWKNSNSEIDVSHLAGNINEISRGGLLVGSASKEYFDSDMGSYVVGSNNGDFRNLVVLNDVRCNGSLGKLIFSGDKKEPMSVQMNGSSSCEVRLPGVAYRNGMAILKLKNINHMESFETDRTAGLVYDNNLGINGGTYNNASSNLDGLCLVAGKGVNNFKKPNGTKYKFGVMYDIPGITDVLDRRGLTITDMTASPSVPAGTRILALNQLSELLNSGAGTVALNGRLKSVKGLNQPEDRITRTKVGQLIGAMINDSAVRAFMQPANTYLLVSIS